MLHPGTNLTVLTGDFIGSLELSAEELSRAIELTSATISSYAGDSLLGFTRTRGDGWQAALTSDARALRISLGISAALTAESANFATRIAIATGDTPNSLPADLNAATGPVFTASGRALDALNGEQRISYANNNALNAVARLADAVTQTWTATQARTAFHLIHPDAPSRASVARQLGVSRQAVDKSAHGAQLPAILDALEMIEATQ